MLLLLFMEFVAFPSRNDQILATNKDKVEMFVSGSMGFFINDKCVQTSPNGTITEDKKIDWCSNIAKKGDDSPYIAYGVRGKAMKLTGYSVRNGCCWYYCCCVDNNGVITDTSCCCELYSFSLQGSNDNRTWKTIHKVEKDTRFYHCMFKTYEFHETESFKFIRFVLDEEYPNCPKCIQLNQIELYGTTVTSDFALSQDEIDNDESVSIIGKVRNNE